MSEPASLSSFTQARLTRDLPPEMLVVLDALSTEQAPAPGEILIATGAVSPGLFFVVSGAVEVVMASAGQDTVVARLGPDEVVGELSAFTGEPAIASARAAELGTRIQFLRLDDLARHPAGVALQQHLIRRLIGNSQERLARAVTTVFAFALGVYYLKFRNLAGPILIHGCLGLGAFMFGLV